MNGVPGVMALESQDFLFFSSSLKVLPIASKVDKCVNICLKQLGALFLVAKNRRLTLPYSDGFLPSVIFVFSLLRRAESSRPLLVHLRTRGDTI